MIATLTVFHCIVSVLLILMVLIHFGKGAEAGLVLDTSSTSILPQKGNVLNKITGVLAALFLGISLALAVLRSHDSGKSVFDKIATTAQAETSASMTDTDEDDSEVNLSEDDQEEMDEFKRNESGDESESDEDADNSDS